MTYAIGTTVVYPNHGAAVVEGSEVRQVNGAPRKYLVLRVVAQRGLVVRVPACNLEMLGVRDVIDEDGLERVLEVLRADSTNQPASWSQRQRVNSDKLRTGSVVRVAEVVRDLSRRQRAGHLSEAEGHVLTKARQILLSELMHCVAAGQEQAEELLDQVLAS
jgi:CarD family transcriptional regulator